MDSANPVLRGMLQAWSQLGVITQKYSSSAFAAWLATLTGYNDSPEDHAHTELHDGDEAILSGIYCALDHGLQLRLCS